MKFFLMTLAALALAGCSFDYTGPSKVSDEVGDMLADSQDSNDGDAVDKVEFNPPLHGDTDVALVDNDSVHGDDDAVHPLSETDAGETILPVDTVADADSVETFDTQADSPDTQNAEAEISLPCIPNCAGKQCGDDGCGKPCGFCTDNFTCTADFVCECVVGCQIPAEPTADADAGTTTTADIKTDSADATDASLDETSVQLDVGAEAEVTILPPPVDTVVNAEPSADTNVAGLDTILLPDITPTGLDTTPSVDTPVCTPKCGNKQCGDDGCGNECGVCDSNSCVKSACVNDTCVDTLVNCDDNNICTNDSCDATLGCKHTNNTAACDDNDACATGDVCVNGACQSNGFIVCEDINPCTNNSCDSVQGCLFIYNSASCEDGNVLTSGDQCQEGQCVSGQSQECDDENPCTDDIADPVKGCLHKANTAPCSDGNLCTLKDTCENSVCVSGENLNCNDFNECTDEVCDSKKGCLYTYNSVACDDADACTANDKCAGGKCLGSTIVCDDGNQCTQDTCDSQSGCKNEPQTGIACNDGNACTTTDACDKDVCVGAAIICNDQNPCTDDSCDSQSGCVYAPNNSNPCEDGSLCTTGDFCDAGKCQGGKALKCEDGNLCTDNVCNSQKGCLYLPNQVGCDDGNSCTVGDTCAGGACESGTNICECTNTADCAGAEDNNLCNGTLICDQSAMPFVCATDPDTIIACNSSQDTACFKNTCVPATGDCEMTAVNEGGACDDGNACTSNDQCASGICAGQSIKCDDSNVCTDDSCDPAISCVFTPNSADCDDNTVCTLVDICQSNKCVGTAPLDCDDADQCTLDVCNKTLGCQHSKTAMNNKACDNNDACTVNDTCQNGVCKAGTQTCECYITSDCAGMEDGNFCNGTLVCDTNAMPHLCVLDPTTVITCLTTLDTTCSKNTCQPSSGKCEMKAVNEGGACDDGNPCTEADSCGNGLCKNGASKPSGTIIFNDDFNDGNMEDWTVDSYNNCPNCSMCPCNLPTIQVTADSPFWVKITSLAGSAHAVLTSPKLFLPAGGTIGFLWANPSPEQCWGWSKCTIIIKGDINATLGSNNNNCSGLPPLCQEKFTIPPNYANQVVLDCTGLSASYIGACGSVHLDDFTITCP